MAKWVSRRMETMTRKRKKLLLDQQDFVKSVVKAKKVHTNNSPKKSKLKDRSGILGTVQTTFDSEKIWYLIQTSLGVPFIIQSGN